MEYISIRKAFMLALTILGFIALPSCSESVDGRLKKIAEEANKTAPRLLDQWTRLDSCTALPNKNIRYYHTVSDVVISDTTLFKSNLKPQVVKVAQTSPDMKFFRENDVTMQYIYNDSAGKYIFSMIVTPQDYK